MTKRIGTIDHNFGCTGTSKLLTWDYAKYFSVLFEKLFNPLLNFTYQFKPPYCAIYGAVKMKP